MTYTMKNYLSNQERAVQPILISKNVIERINKENESGVEGILYGLVGPRVLVLSIIYQGYSKDLNSKKHYFIPGNYKRLGTFFTYGICRGLQSPDFRQYRLVISKDVTTGTIESFVITGSEFPVDLDVIDQNIINDITMKFKMHGNLFVNRNEFFRRGAKFGNMNKFVFRFRNSPWFISYQTGPLDRKSVSIFDVDSGSLEFFEIDILFTKCYSGNFLTTPQLVLAHKARKFTLESMMKIEVDAMCVFFRDGELNFYAPLQLTLKRFLRFYRSVAATVDSVDKISEIKTAYFFPEPLGHLVTRLYHEGEEINGDVGLKILKFIGRISGGELRLDLLKTFRLDLKPYFNIDCSTSKFAKKIAINSLINVHLGVGNFFGRALNEAVVSGTYAFYHCKQDGVIDYGWGGAYRAFQIIFSWFMWQGYTSEKVPTIRAIQENLVQLGVKDASFIGSNRWIGTTEVAACLESMLHIFGEILYLCSGLDMQYVGRELNQHFATHGSPIMISGGQSAHIILGVDYDVVTGHIQFLVLDPHYDGIDDIETIQREGGVEWKELDFWCKDDHYNLCVPLLPISY